PGGGPRVSAGGPGVRVGQLALADRPLHALVPVPVVPDGPPAIAAVATGSVVRGRRLRAGHDHRPDLRDPGVEGPLPPALIGRPARIAAVPPALRLRVRGFVRG